MYYFLIDFSSCVMYNTLRYLGVAQLGSEVTAAGGGKSELSEWQRSADDDAAPSTRKMPGTATGSAPAL